MRSKYPLTYPGPISPTWASSRLQVTLVIVGWLIPFTIDSALPQRVSVLLRLIPASLMFDLPHLLPARWRAAQAHAGWRLQRLAFLQVAPGTCAAHNRRAPGYHEAIRDTCAAHNRRASTSRRRSPHDVNNQPGWFQCTERGEKVPFGVHDVVEGRLH